MGKYRVDGYDYDKFESEKDARLRDFELRGRGLTDDELDDIFKDVCRKQFGDISCPVVPSDSKSKFFKEEV